MSGGERLRSDEVNYLIWRYLQEFGLGQTAARLQRDWGQPNPEALPFASRIPQHSLVILLHKGLRFHEFETSIDQQGNRKPPVPFFSADGASSGIKKSHADGPASEAGRVLLEGLTNGVAHDADAASGAPPSKRRRNGGGMAASSRARNGDAMDVDQQSGSEAPLPPPPAPLAPAAAGAAPSRDAATGLMDLDADPNSKREPQHPAIHESDASRLPQTNGDTASPHAAGDADETTAHHAHANATPAPPVPVVPTLTNGHNVGVQCEKVADLGPETAVLKVPSRDVSHVHWNPRDPTLLAAGGEALCRIWTLPTSTLGAERPSKSGLAPNDASSAAAPLTADAPLTPQPSSQPQPSAPDAHAPSSDGLATILKECPVSDVSDLPDVSAGYIVTAMAWSDDGSRLAVALHSPDTTSRGTVLIRDKHGEVVEELPGAQHFVLTLAWNPSSTLLLGAAHSGSGGSSPVATNGDNTNDLTNGSGDGGGNGSSGSSSTLMVWDVPGGRHLEPLHVPNPVLGAGWLDERLLVVCGPQALATVAVHPQHLEVTRADLDAPLAATLPPAARHWTRLVADPVSHTAAVLAERTWLGVLHLGRPLEARRAAGGKPAPAAAHDAHEPTYAVTAAQYQPLARPGAWRPDRPRLLATAAEDGSVRVWDARPGGALVRALALPAGQPALACAFAPDGHLLAAAGPDRVVFWAVAEGDPPRAVWRHPAVGLPARLPLLMNGTAGGGAGAKPLAAADVKDAAGDVDMDSALGGMDDDDEGEGRRALSWDAEGRRVAYGARDEVSIISFPRR